MKFIHTFTSKFPAEEQTIKKVNGKTIKEDIRTPRIVYGFYTLVDYTCPKAKCMIYSSESAALLDCNAIEPMDFISSKTYHAMNYGGFQFGQWNGQLGDGRVLHHGDIRNGNGQIWEIVLKGVGITPFSRYGDGLLTLKSAVKEYLGLEYLKAVGIPTTRALALYTTGELITRENSDLEKESILARISPSWIRFGQFELFYLRGDYKRLLQLTDYVIDTFYPKLSVLPNMDENRLMKNKYALFFECIVKDYAFLIAKWQAAGFVHGVLNTENLSIHGISLHLGPFAFLDVYDPSFASNLTGIFRILNLDHEKRYSFEAQPDVIHQNLCSLGKALCSFFVSKNTEKEVLNSWKKYLNLQPIASPVITSIGTHSLPIDYISMSDMICRHILSQYYDLFIEFFTVEMQKKLGFEKRLESDYETIIVPLLQILADSRADYCYFFRLLGTFSTMDANFESDYDYRNHKADENKSPILFHLLAGHANFLKQVPDLVIQRDDIASSWIEWAKIYRKRLLKETDPELDQDERDSKRMKRMNLVNPKYSLKSWILSEICDGIDDSEKSTAKVKQAIRILIEDVWGNETSLSSEDRRVANAWSCPCYDKFHNQYQLNCP